MLKPRKRLVKSKLKEDKLLTFTFRVQETFRTYRKTVSYILATVLVLVVAYGLVSSSKRSAIQQSAFEELMARDAYSRGELDETLSRIEVILNEYPNSPSAASALMLKGRIYQQRGEYAMAEEAFKEVTRKFPDNDYLAFGAYYALGSIYYGKRDYSESAKYYQGAAKRYPHHFNAPYALVEAAGSLEKISKYEEAGRLYRTVLKEYPKSRVADKARTNLSELEFMG